MKKVFIYLILTIVTISLVGCGGSGGGGSSSHRPTVPELNANLATDYPIVNENYSEIKNIMKSSTKEQGEQDALVSSLLGYFSDDFKDKKGNSAKTKIESTTKDYLSEWNIVSYEFVPAVEDGVSHTVDPNTNILTVKTFLKIHVTDKAAGSSSINTDGDYFDLQWEKQPGNPETWKIIAGFPTTRAELGI